MDANRLKDIATAVSRNPWAVALMGYVFPPIAMVCVWLHPIWAKRTKWIAFGVLAILMLLRNGGGRPKPEEPSVSAEATASASDSAPRASSRDAKPADKKTTTASAAYKKMVAAAERGGHKMCADLSGQGRDGLFSVLHASVWHKSKGEDDDVLLIAEVAPLPADSHLLADNYAVRSGINALAVELHGMLSRGCPQDALNFGTDSQGNRFIKTEENGSTRFHAAVLVGKEPCEITWVQQNRSYPDSRFSTTMIKTGWTMFTAQTFDQGVDMRESTIRAMRRLLTGGGE